MSDTNPTTTTPPITQSVFELVLLRGINTATGEHPRLAHLHWRAPQQGRCLVQVYVDDELFDVSSDYAQREMWLPLDRSAQHRIELLAVDPQRADVWRAYPEALRTWQPDASARLHVALLRDEALPADTRLSFTLNDEPAGCAAMWDAHAHRGGFGGLFGEGAFGFDAATGPGLGEGELGMGPLGADSAALPWRSAPLDAGTHTLRITAHDAAGRASSPALVHTATTSPLPAPPRALTVDQEFTLRIAR